MNLIHNSWKISSPRKPYSSLLGISLRPSTSATSSYSFSAITNHQTVKVLAVSAILKGPAWSMVSDKSLQNLTNRKSKFSSKLSVLVLRKYFDSYFECKVVFCICNLHGIINFTSGQKQIIEIHLAIYPITWYYFNKPDCFFRYMINKQCFFSTKQQLIIYIYLYKWGSEWVKHSHYDIILYSTTPCRWGKSDGFWKWNIWKNINYCQNSWPTFESL